MNTKTLLSAAMLLATPLAQAADPAQGGFTDEALSLAWGGGPFVIPNVTPDAGEPVCAAPMLCDDYALTVDLSDDFRKLPENQRENVQFAIQFPVTAPVVDYELYLYNDAGAIVAEASSGPGIQETVTVPLKTLKNGSYIVRVVPYLPLATSYTATAQVGKADAEASKGLSLMPQAGAAPLTVTLDATRLSAQPASSGYVFDFGDGSLPVTDADGVVEHVYQTDGQYLATVRFSDASGSKALAKAAQPVFVGDVGDLAKSGNGAMGGAFGAGVLLPLLGLLGLRRRR